jgi:prefoldin subunit 5
MPILNGSMTPELKRLEERLAELLNEAEELQGNIEALNSEKARMVASNPNILANAAVAEASSSNG